MAEAVGDAAVADAAVADAADAAAGVADAAAGVADAAAIAEFVEFNWNIENPFIPWQEQNATFFFGSQLSVTAWEMKILPSASECSNTWEFLFRLKCLRPAESDNVAGELGIDIDLVYTHFDRTEPETVQIVSKDDIFSVREDNDRTYDLRVVVRDPGNMLLPILKIKVLLFLKENDHEYYKDDLRKLSEDLRALRNNPINCDMFLRPNNTEREVAVHSYILNARWNNFSDVNLTRRIGNNRLVFDVSERVLWAIVNYAYYGLGIAEAVQGRQITGGTEKTEIYKIIDRYRLHGVSKFFVQNELLQTRNTVRPCMRRAVEFPLNNQEKNIIARDIVFNWRPFPDTSCDFDLDIHFVLNPDSPSFSYTLRSRSLDLRFARMAVMLRTRQRFPVPDILQLLYGENYTFRPNESKSVQNLPFIQPLPSRLAEYLQCLRDQRTTGLDPYIIVCTLAISDESMATDLAPGEFNAAEFKNENELLEDLSNDMSKVLTLGIACDFLIECETLNPGSPNEVHSLHRAILECRVPNWQAALENLVVGDNVPSRATCRFSSEAFRHILNYIYTGKLGRLNTELFEEVYDFADLTEFEALKALIRKLNGIIV